MPRMIDGESGLIDPKDLGAKRQHQPKQLRDATLESDLLPRANAKTGIYVDEGGDEWIPLNNLRKEFGVQYASVKKRIEGIRSLSGRAGNGRPTTLFCRAEVIERVSDLITLPRTNEEGLLADERGVRWVPAQTLIDQYSINRRTLQRYLAQVPSMDGRTRNGHVTCLYDGERATEQVAKFLSLPKVDQEQSVYTNPEGKEWVPLSELNRYSGVSYRTLSQMLRSVSTILGRDRNGKETILYDRQVALNVVDNLLKLPQADRKTGKYIDASAEGWIPLDHIVTRMGAGVGSKRFKELLRSVRSIVCRDMGGHVGTFYNEVEAAEIVKRLESAPLASSKNGFYQDELGVNWGTEGYLRRKYHIAKETLEEVLRGITFKECRNKAGRIIPFFNIAEAEGSILSNMVEAEGGNVKQAVASGDRSKLEEKIKELEEWVTLNSLCSEFGISEKAILKRLEGVSARNGIGANGHTCVVYDGKLARERLISFLSLSQVSKATGEYIDGEGKKWVTIPILRGLTHLSHSTICTALKEAETRQGRGRSGGNVVLYEKDEAMKILEVLSMVPKVDGETGMLEAGGERWVNLEYLLQKHSLNSKSALTELRKASVRCISGRTKNGLQTPLYNLEEATLVLSLFANLPQLDKTSAIYVDKAGHRWVSAKYLRNKYKLSNVAISRICSASISLQGKDRSGRSCSLYDLESIAALIEQHPPIKRNHSKEVVISTEEANEELNALLEEDQ